MKTVAISLLGTMLDRGSNEDRWSRWRPNMGLVQQEDLVIDRLELLFQPNFQKLADQITQDVQTASPHTKVVQRHVDFKKPWDFEEVYASLHDYARETTFAPDKESYLVHITTGTHVAQICMFLLTESRYIPGQLIQTIPPKGRTSKSACGSYDIIDLDLSKYDRIASRFRQNTQDDIAFLKSGIKTRNKAFNQLIGEIEHVCLKSPEPILLIGPTGAGKSQLAKRIEALKRARGLVSGRFVQVNCATLRGDAALSTLFGHRKGAFTGALSERQGLLREADQGLVFLDEIGELGLDEQAMLLRAIEEKQFLPMGADREVKSDFQLICGTNRDLSQSVAKGTFREDLLERINLWTFHFPGLRDRLEDIEPNLDYEMDRFAESHNRLVRFSKEAKLAYLKFAQSSEALWTGNFRDLNSSITRMATLAPGGRITRQTVKEEIIRLRRKWCQIGQSTAKGDLVQSILGEQKTRELDPFDLVQLEEVLKVCLGARSASEAGRHLFAVSRTKRKSTNDSDRLRKYLARFGLKWPIEMRSAG